MNGWVRGWERWARLGEAAGPDRGLRGQAAWAHRATARRRAGRAQQAAFGGGGPAGGPGEVGPVAQCKQGAAPHP